jgi:hypothetical protein
MPPPFYVFLAIFAIHLSSTRQAWIHARSLTLGAMVNANKSANANMQTLSQNNKRHRI